MQSYIQIHSPIGAKSPSNCPVVMVPNVVMVTNFAPVVMVTNLTRPRRCKQLFSS